MGPSDACRAQPPTGLAPSRPGRAIGLLCCQSPRAYVLRPLPRRAERSSRVGVSDRPRRPSSNERRLGARIQSFGACSGFTRVAARTLADPPKADLCPRGFDGSVALPASRVATKVYRHLLGPDFHRLRSLTLHGTLSFDLTTSALRPPRLLPARDSPGLPGGIRPRPGRPEGGCVATRALTLCRLLDTGCQMR